MKWQPVSKIVGIFLILFSFTMLPPILVNWIYQQQSASEFWAGFVVTLAAGLLMWAPFHRRQFDVKVRDGFLVVVLFWVVLSLFGTLPLLLSTAPQLSFTDAFFETASGLTTTGATILDHIDQLPNSIRIYRQELQFIGGMGIIVLAVAILPMLGVGGMQLFRAETPGPIKDIKLKPRIQESAKILWYIYVGLTVLCAFSYWVAGMSAFDAIGESLTTVSTGGFTMHDASFGYYKSNPIEVVAIIFMLLSSINFALHFTVFKTRNILNYIKDIEFRTYIIFMFIIFLIVFVTLSSAKYYSNSVDIFMDSLFDTVSIVSTTGYTSSSFAYWPSFLPILMMIGGMIGGCAASTSGGIKVIRLILLFKQCVREMHRLIHPRAIFTIKFGRQILPEHVIQAMWSFIAAFIALFVIILLLLMAAGLNFETAFGSVVASLSNVGASIADVADNFQQINTFSKWVIIFAMFLGRLEIFTVLVLFSPLFWRR